MAMAAKVPEPGAAGERRRSRRKNIIGSQLLTVDVALGGTTAERQWQRGIVIDLSEVGMAIQPFLPLTQGTVGDVRIELPGDPKPVTSAGMVAWVGQGGRAGIRFIDVPAEAREQLREWLSRNPRGVPQEEELFLPESAASAPLLSPEFEDDTNLELVDSDEQESESEEVDFQAALQLIAERAQLITSASGAAVAIGDNNGMVCRASTGAAPDVGAQLRPDSGLSGYCLNSGEIVYCADTQADPRIDADAARQLDLGSIIIVPVFVAGRLAGVLEVLSSHPQAFDDRQVIRLERFAELLGATVEEHQHSRSTETEDREAAGGNEDLKFTSATVPQLDPPELAHPLTASEALCELTEASTETAIVVAPPPSPSFVFDSTVTAFPGTTIVPAIEAAPMAAPPQLEPADDMVTRVLSVTAAAPEPIKPTKPSGPIFLATPTEWTACKACGHQNPPWAKLCENCHSDGSEKLAIPPGQPNASDEGNAVAEGRRISDDAEAPLFAYSAPLPGIRWARLALIAGVIILVALAGLAGLYFGRRARSEPPPIPTSVAPASAILTPPALALDSATAVTPKPQSEPSGPPAPVVAQTKSAAPKAAAKAIAKKPAAQLSAAERKTMWPEKGKQ
jgi:GAF domain-containing protein